MNKNAVGALADDSPRNRVAKYLREEILSGRIGMGESLPTERQIAETFGVARGTVRAALEVLEREELIQARKHAKRIATPRHSPQEALMSKTYVLLTHLAEVPHLEPGSGMIEAVESGILRAGREAGLHGLLLQQNCLTDGYLEAILRSHPCGVFLTSPLLNLPDIATRLASVLSGVRLPVVVNSADPRFSACDRVVFDHAAGSALLTEFLIKRGAQRILRVWSSPAMTDWVRERSRGYEEVMRKAGLPVLPVVAADYLPPDCTEIAARARCYAGVLIEHLRSAQPPQAIMVTADSDVFPVAAACRLCGVEPERDITIVGYDNNWRDNRVRHGSDYAPPATVDKHNFAAGMEMMRLMRRRREEPGLPPQTILVQPELVLTRPGENHAHYA